MDNDFYIVENRNSTALTDGLYKKEIINAICDNTERRHYTTYPNVIKLCRICMRDVCKELTERINWETTLYKKYKDAMTSNKEPLFNFTLEQKISEAKAKYTEYTALYNKFKRVKLCTDACIICEERSAAPFNPSG